MLRRHGACNVHVVDEAKGDNVEPRKLVGRFADNAIGSILAFVDTDDERIAVKLPPHVVVRKAAGIHPLFPLVLQCSKLVATVRIQRHEVCARSEPGGVGRLP